MKKKNNTLKQIKFFEMEIFTKECKLKIELVDPNLIKKQGHSQNRHRENCRFSKEKKNNTKSKHKENRK